MRNSSSPTRVALGISRRTLLRRGGASIATGVVSGCTGDQSTITTLLNMAQGIAGSASLGERDEIAIGNGLYGRVIDASGGYYRNAVVQSSIRKFAAPLIRTTTRPTLPWEIAVIDDNGVNAWALPGGKIAINKGLLRYVASDSELAAVIAHEIGHAELGHGIQAMRTQTFTRAVSGAGQQLLERRAGQSGLSGITGPILDSLQGPLTQLVMSGYSREAEAAADRHILGVFAQVGYAPNNASRFFRTLLELVPQDTTATTSLFSTHAGTQARISALDAEAVSLPAPSAAPASAGFAQLKQVFPTREYFHRHPIA